MGFLLNGELTEFLWNFDQGQRFRFIITLQTDETAASSKFTFKPTAGIADHI